MITDDLWDAEWVWVVLGPSSAGSVWGLYTWLLFFIFFLFVIKNNLLLYEVAEIPCCSKVQPTDELARRFNTQILNDGWLLFV